MKSQSCEYNYNLIPSDPFEYYPPIYLLLA